MAADPAARVAVREFGTPLTPGELADLKSRRWDPDLHAPVRGYGLLFPDDYAGAWINQKASGVTIAFKNRVDRHRTALSSLVPPGPAVEVRQVEWSLADLEGFEKRIDADEAWFDSLGVRVEPSIQFNDNRVDVKFHGPKDAGNQSSTLAGRPSSVPVTAGSALWENLPAADYRIRLHEWVENAHYDPDPIKEFGVVLEPEGTNVRVVIPTF